MDDEVTEHQLHGLVAAIRREDAADERRRARWRRDAACGDLSVRAVLGAASDEAVSPEVIVTLVGAGPSVRGEVLALGADHVVLAEATGDRLLVALAAIEAVAVPNRSVEAMAAAIERDDEGGPTGLAPELGRRLAGALDALAPFGAQVRTTSGRWHSGRLLAVGGEVVLVRVGGALQVISLGSVAVVRIEAHGAAGGPDQSSSPPLSPLPTTSG